MKLTVKRRPGRTSYRLQIWKLRLKSQDQGVGPDTKGSGAYGNCPAPASIMNPVIPRLFLPDAIRQNMSRVPASTPRNR
jgi:hypothetical protein